MLAKIAGQEYLLTSPERDGDRDVHALTAVFASSAFALLARYVDFALFGVDIKKLCDTLIRFTKLAFESGALSLKRVHLLLQCPDLIGRVATVAVSSTHY